MIGTSLGKSSSGKTSIERDSKVDTDVQEQKVDEIKSLENDNDKSISKENDYRIIEEYKRVKSFIKN